LNFLTLFLLDNLRLCIYTADLSANMIISYNDESTWDVIFASLIDDEFELKIFWIIVDGNSKEKN